MKISIRIKDNIFKRITIFLPLSLIKSQMIWKMVINHASSEEKENFKSIYNFVMGCYKELKKIIKKSGHFYLLEMNNDDACIRIKV